MNCLFILKYGTVLKGQFIIYVGDTWGTLWLDEKVGSRIAGRKKGCHFPLVT